MGNTTSIAETAFEPAAVNTRNPKKNKRKKRPQTPRPRKKVVGYNLPTKALTTAEKQKAAEKRKANKENREKRRDYPNIMMKLFQDRKNTPQRKIAQREDKERKKKNKKAKSGREKDV